MSEPSGSYELDSSNNREEIMRKLASDLEAEKQIRSARKSKGIPALMRLAEVANGGSGQCRQVRLVLLGLYNGASWPLDLTGLRGLDADLQKAVLDVIELDWCGHEIHTYIENGEAMFQDWWERETGRQE